MDDDDDNDEDDDRFVMEVDFRAGCKALWCNKYMNDDDDDDSYVMAVHFRLGLPGISHWLTIHSKVFLA